MTLSDRAARLALVLATTVGATFTVLVAGGSGSLEALPIRTIYIGMAALALIPWLVGAIFRPSWHPSSRLAPGIVAILVAYVIATITSRNPRLSVEMLGYAVLLMLVYLLLVTLMRRPAIRAHFERLALLLCILVAGLYVLQVSIGWIDWWGLVGHVTIPPLRPGYAGLTLGSPNPVATLVLLLGAFALATTELHGRAGRGLGTILIALVAVVTFISGSRGAWLGGLIAVTVAVAVTAALRPALRVRATRLARSRWGLTALAVGGPVVASAVAFAAISGRLTVEDGGYRAGFARASLQMFDSAPLTGVGPGMWGVLRAQTSLATDVDLYIPHAHNIYLQTLAEFGIAGVIAGSVLIGVLGVMTWRAITSGDRSRQVVSIAALFALALFAAQQVADVLVNVPALLLAVALPIAWLDAADRPVAEVDATGKVRVPGIVARRWLLGATLGTTLVMLGLVRIEAIANTADTAVAAADAGRWSEATALFGEAAAADPDVSAYQFQLGVSAANAGNLPLAERALAMSADADDYTYAWLDLAAVRWKLGDLPGARAAVGRAERLGLQRLPVALGAGWLRQQLGDDEAAIEDYAAAVVLDPTLAMDPFWSSPSGPSGGFEAVLRAAEVRASDAALLHLYLVLGRFEDAQVQGAALAISGGDFYAGIVPAWQGDDAAWSSLQALTGQRPLDGERATWCRLVAVHLGDENAIRRYGAWLGALGSGSVELPRQAGIRFGPPQPLPPLFLDRYGSVYRRDILAASIVRLLPQPAWTRGPQTVRLSLRVKA